ncbi:MAG: RNA methyltransferase [Chloroflexota bacterium]
MITSQQNERIKWARRLQKQRQKHKKQDTTQQLILVEGVRLVADALESNVEPQMIFYSSEMLTKNVQGQYLLEQCLAMPQVDCIDCAPSVLASLTTTKTPQGIVSVVPMPTLPLPIELTMVLILDQIREPGNAGTLLRTAEAAGVELVLFAPRTVDPFNDKVLRAGMGVHFRLPIRVYEQWDEMLAFLVDWGKPLYLAEQRATRPYDDVVWTESCGLIVSGETIKASDEADVHATPIMIPMLGQTESLNAAIAGAVILFEAARQRRVEVRR